MEKINLNRDLHQATDAEKERRREESIARAAQDFNLDRGSSLVAYIRELRARSPEGSSYDIAALLWQLAGIQPDPLQTFEKFDLKKNTSLKTALDAAAEWGRGKGPPLLTLAGAPGVGKTFLAIAVAQDIIQRGSMVIYRRTDELLEQCQGEMLNHQEQFTLDVKYVPWLILDDMGLQRSTPWGDQFLDGLVDLKYRGHARLMICTNAKKQELSPRIADRLGDVALGRVITIVAPSHRTGR